MLAVPAGVVVVVAAVAAAAAVDPLRVLERDREWMVDALCWDDELWRLPARDPEADPLAGFLLLDRPTRAKRANPASLRGSVELLPVTFLSTSGSCSGSTGRESQESRRWASANDSMDGAGIPEFMRISMSRSSSLSSTLCTLSDTIPEVVLDEVLLMTDIRWSLRT